MSKVIFSAFALIIFFLFSCTPDKKHEGAQENNFFEKDKQKKIISIYLAENQLNVWNNISGKYQVEKNDKIPANLFLPLGLQEIKSIQKDKIIIGLPSNEITSKLKTKQLKTSFLDSIIPIKIIALEKALDSDNYTLIILPSKPDEYGNFKTCISCPFNEQELYLKCKLEWENIFGNFKKTPKEAISNPIDN